MWELVVARVYSLDEAFCQGIFADTYICLGVFDGVHIGHRALIDATVHAAQTCPSGPKPVIVITFNIDPDEMFKKAGLQKIMPNDVRIAELAKIEGVDAICVLDFDKALASMYPREFLDILFENAEPAGVFVGEGFRFGRGAQGTAKDLSEWAHDIGAYMHVQELTYLDGERISSSRIRALLAKNDLDGAARLLGHNYFLEGEVIKGDGRGTSLGFATANFHLYEEYCILERGVYGGYAIVDGIRYKAAISMGETPTFQTRNKANLEVHILDFEGDLYDKSVRVEFIKRLRDMKKFDTVDELTLTVKADIDYIRQNF
jgi:riboflavin kinase/FMN adenylyltransferase